MIPVLRFAALGALALLSACGKGPPADPGRSESFARSWLVNPAPGTAEQQLVLPAETLLALKEPDLADLRLFDGAGRVLPMACFKDAEERSQVMAMRSYPVLARTAPRDGGVALAIGPDKVARVIDLAGEPGQERQIATLIDSRAVTSRVIALQFSAQLPLQQPVTFRAAVSSDLKTWEPVGEKTLFRTDAQGNQLEQAQLTLDGIVVKDRYLQLTWDAPSGVTVSGAQLLAGLDRARPSVALGTTGASLADPHDLRFAVPAGMLPDAIDLALAGNEGVVPVQLFSRRNAEASWQPMVATTLRSGGASGSRLTLDGAAGREFRVTADRRTAGFAAVPRLTLRYGGVVLLARFNGKPPYRLAAGLAGAPRNLLTSADIVPRGNPADLPQAQIAAGPAPTVTVAPEADQGPLGGHRVALWLVLLGGVAMLSLAVLRLLRKGQVEPDDQSLS